MYQLLVTILTGATSFSVAHHQFEELEAHQRVSLVEPVSLPAFCSDRESPFASAAERSIHAVMFPDPTALVTAVAQRVIDEYCQPPSPP